MGRIGSTLANQSDEFESLIESELQGGDFDRSGVDLPQPEMQEVYSHSNPTRQRVEVTRLDVPASDWIPLVVIVIAAQLGLAFVVGIILALAS